VSGLPDIIRLSTTLHDTKQNPNDGTTIGVLMDKKWCLLKTSDGARGQAGKKKVYEITISGTYMLTSWGMAEKTQRQSAKQRFPSHAAASQAASMKMYEKLGKGYELVYTV
jgi:predicted DNA-binding WGR domain protein